MESEELVKFIASVFQDNNMGSRIIMGMMTVVGKDAERCDGHMSKMRPLQDEQSVTWFLNEAEQRSTFSGFREQDRSSSCLQKICDGVPLALVSVCEVRRGSISAAAVEEACRELRRVEKDRWPHRMPVVLPHSYDSLHIRSAGSCKNQYIPYLQACLLYFAMFPRGNVKRGSLIRRWQAEGLEFGDTNQAAENLKTLVDRNFVWPLHVSTDEHQHAKTCQPPGVVLDYISRMSEMEEFILKSCPSGGLTTNCSRRLCLHPPGEDKTEPLVITNDSVPPRLRTLAVSWGHQEACMIAKCEQLRVLDLDSYKGLQATELEEICQKLRLLKYLSLLPDIITELPTSMSNLKYLETLELGEVKGKAAVLVPIEVIGLPCMKHLIGKFELMDRWHKIPNRFWVKVPEAIKESKLERLSGFVTRRGQGFPPLMCHMKNLRKVKIWFYTDADAKYVSAYLPDAITKFLKNGKGPHSLSLDFQDCPSSRQLVVDSLAKASGELYSLKLSGEKLSKIDFFVITYNTKLTGITKLFLCWKEITLDKWFLDELSKLNQLMYLKLDAETINGQDVKYPQAGHNQAKVVIETTHIKNLERMCLVAKQTLADIEINHTALKKLVSLHLISGDIYYCPSANMIRTANGQVGAPLKNLREVALNATVREDSRNRWREAARNHPNRPKVLFIEHPHRAG